MSGNVIGTATIQIVSDVSRFTADLKTKIENAIRQAEATVEASAEQMEDSIRQVGDVIEVTFTEVKNDVESSMEQAEQSVRQFGDVVDTTLADVRFEADQTGDVLDREMSTALVKVRNDIERFGGSFATVMNESEFRVNSLGETIETSTSTALVKAKTDVELYGAKWRDTTSEIELYTERIENSIQETGVQAEQTGERIERAYAEAGRKADRHMGVMGGMMGGMLKGGALAAGAAIGAVGVSAFQAGLEMTGSFDKAEASFTALTGSAAEGKKLLEDVKGFAFKTPFDVKQVADQTRNLLAQGQAYGVTKDNVLQYATAIGDAVALTGGGEIEFQRVTRALGQMGSSSKVMAQDMNQLQQSIPGINVWKELGEGLGVTEAQAREMGAAGLIPGAQAANILTQAMREMPGAAGEMERQASTVTGALQNFKEQATSALTEGMRPFTDALRTFLASTEAKTAIAQLGAGFGQLLAAMAPIFPVITQLASTFGGFLGAIGTAIQPVMRVLGPIFTNLLIRLEGPLTVVAETFGMLLMAVMPIVDVLAELMAVGAELIADMLVALQPAITAIAQAFADIAPIITPLIEQLANELSPFVKELGNAFSLTVQALIPLLPPLIELAMMWFPIIIQVLPIMTLLLRLLSAFILNVVKPNMEKLGQALQGLVGFWNNVRDAITGMWNKLKEWWNYVVNFPSKVKQKFQEVKDAIVNKVKEIDLFGAGKSAVEGLWNGISNKVGWIGQKISGFAGDLVDKFKNAFKIFSPSQVMADEIGAPMAEGLAVGFENQMKSLAPNFANDMTVTSIGATAGGGAASTGIVFNGPVSFGSDAASAVGELDWMRRTRMGAA